MILRLPPKTYQESSHTIDKLWNSSQKSFLHFWVDGATTHTCNQNFLEQSKSFILANTFNNFLCACVRLKISWKEKLSISQCYEGFYSKIMVEKNFQIISGKGHA